MTDLLTENARLRAALEAMLHAVCGETGFASAVRLDSGLAYPWPALDDAEATARAAIATPAPDAVQEAARVPEIAALIEAASALGVRDMVAGWNGEGREHPYTPHPASLRAKINTTCGAVYALDAALRAIAGGQP